MLDGQEYGLAAGAEAYQQMRLQGSDWQAVEAPVKLPAGVLLTLVLEGRVHQPCRRRTDRLLWLSGDGKHPLPCALNDPPLRQRRPVQRWPW